jgi:hypothetical protein
MVCHTGSAVGTTGEIRGFAFGSKSLPRLVLAAVNLAVSRWGKSPYAAYCWGTFGAAGREGRRLALVVTVALIATGVLFASNLANGLK